jgi:hypothetical protein
MGIPPGLWEGIAIGAHLGPINEKVLAKTESLAGSAVCAVRAGRIV